METAETAKIISEHFSAWKHLTKDEQDGMLANTILMRYQKGASIHNGENDCKGMLIIRKGVLRTYMLSESGKEITLYRLSAGDVCVLAASCVLSEITFEVQIDAEGGFRGVFHEPSVPSDPDGEEHIRRVLRLQNGDGPVLRRYVGHAADPVYEHGQTAGRFFCGMKLPNPAAIRSI